MTLQKFWRQKSDEDLARAAQSLHDYTAEAEQVIRAEIRRRKLTEPPPVQREIQKQSQLPKLRPPVFVQWCYALAGMAGVLFYLGMKNHEIREYLEAHSLGGVLILAFFLFSALGFLSLSNHRSKVQRTRDQQANKLADKVLTGAYPGPFFLYLRPFAHTGKIRQWNPRKTYVPFLPGFFEPGKLELEMIFSDALSEKAPLVALGSPGEQFGSGRLSVDEKEWRKVVEQLIRKAYAILVVPSYHEGTKWEIAAIRKMNHLHKCIFVMPPKARFSGVTMAEEWRRASEALHELQITLPVYSKWGLLFTLDAIGMLKDSQRFDLTSEKKLSVAVEGLLEGTPIPLPGGQGLLARQNRITGLFKLIFV